MKINFVKILPWGLLVFINLLIIPTFIPKLQVVPIVYTVYAQTNCPSDTDPVAGTCVPKVTGSGILGSKTFAELAKNLINVLLYIAGTIAVVFIIIGGYQYLTSGGNEESAEKGRKTLINAIIGIVVIVLSYVIINVVVRSVAGGT